jgi:hypothetical protein
MGKATEFKVGQRVKCVDDVFSSRELTAGETYEVVGHNLGDLRLDGLKSSWRSSRFTAAPLFAVGDKVLATKDDCDITKGNTYIINEVDDEDDECPYCVTDDAGENWWLSAGTYVAVPTYSSCAAAEVDNLADEYGGAKLNIVAGRYYETLDGRKVGPMVGYGFDDRFCVEFGDGRFWMKDGTAHGDTNGADLIAEWQDAPVVAPVVASATTAKFKVGDRVKFRDDYGSSARGNEATVIKLNVWGKYGVQVDQGGKWGISTESASSLELLPPTTIADIVRKHSPAIVCRVDNGQPLQSTRPFVHHDSDAASDEAGRLAKANPGKEFAVYEYKRSAKVDRVYDHEWQRIAKDRTIAPWRVEKRAAEALSKQSGIPIFSAEKAVSDWLKRAA